MTDILGAALGAVGRAAKPLEPAIDFLAPARTNQGGADLSIGGLINSVGRGLQNTIDEGLVGLGSAAYNAVTMRGMSARDRLLLGGLALAGGAMSARAIHAGWKANQPVRMHARTMRAPSTSLGGYGDLTDRLGDPQRFVDNSDEARDLLYQRPGINRKQAQILASDDGVSVARGFAEFDLNDDVRLAAAAGLFETYASRVPEGARGAQIDWARFAFAIDSGKVRGTPGNARVKKLWRAATEAPETLKPEEAEELFSYVQLLGDRTDGITADDFSVGLAGRIEHVDFADGDVRFYVSHPVGWDDGASVDPYTRAKRLQQLNVRQLADRGHKMIRQLFDIGDQQYKLFQETGQTDLPKGMHLGRDWYPVALEDTKKAFGVDDGDALDRAVAAVSFLSEAEEWATNVYKARRILDLAGDVSDEDFQAWLRHGVTPDAYDTKIARHQYAGTRAKEHERRFAQIWETVKKGPPGEGGFKVDEITMKKVLRLYGGVEPVDDVFRSTKARKQKNFYLNIRHPDYDWPVTIDRHAYDAFYGMDAGIQDRPIDAAIGAGDQTYDVIADTYRAVAREIAEESGEQVLPHQVQAVVWEVWRILKGTAGRDGWGARLDGASAPTPFMMTLPGETSNPVFDALMGKSGLTGALGQDLSGPVPVTLLEASDVHGLSAVSVGDDYVVLADMDDKVAAAVRTKTPGVIGDDRIARWVDSQPLKVRSMDEFVATATEDVHWVETTLASDHVGGVHPALRPTNTIVAYVDDGAKLRTPPGVKARRAGRASIQTQNLSYERLGPDDIDPKKWRGKDSPLNTHAWAGISAELNDGQIAALGIADYDKVGYTNQLRAELLRRGYKPIETNGVYGGAEEASFIVFGISPREAREIGEMFNQESVLTNDGLIYNRAIDSPDAGRLRRPLNMEIDPPGPKDKSELYDRSELVIGNRRLRFRQNFDWEGGETEDIVDDLMDQRVTKNRERVEIDIPAGRNIHELVTDLEGRGFKDISVYANRDQLPGFDRAYERVVTDGSSVTVVRTADGAISDPHGSHVFTRSASGLPKRPKKPVPPGWTTTGDGVAIAGNTLLIDGRFPTGNVEFTGPFRARLNGQSPIAWGYVNGSLTPIFDEAELNSGRFEATIKGDKITPADESDVTGAIRAHQALRDAGYPQAVLSNDKGNVKKMKLVTSAGTFSFGEEKVTTASSEVVTTRNGLAAVQWHNDRKVPRFERLYGLQLDVGWRSGRQQHALDGAMVQQLEEGVGLVFNEHEPVIHRARLIGITTENVNKKDPAYAYFPFAPDQRIVVTRQFWEDQARFERQLAEDRASGWLSPRVEPTARSIIVHELGHVMHLSARMGEGMVNNSNLEREVLALVGGKRNLRTVAEREISTTAGVEISELIAESVSEVLLADRPSKLAKDVYAVLTDHLGDYMKHHNMRPQAQPVGPPVAPRKVSAAVAPVLEPSVTVTDPKFWGGGLAAMFPSDSLSVPAPFPSAAKHKKLQAYDQELVNEAVRAGVTTEIDPRSLYATQPSVTRDGVRHYLESPDVLYADQTQAGNQTPVIYRRDEGNGRVRNLILSGTHRAAAALAAGRPLTAIVVDGPWGSPR